MDALDRIDALLKEKNMSRRQLALKVGIPVSTLSAAYSRKSREDRTVSLSRDVLPKIALALGVDVAFLVGISIDREGRFLTEDAKAYIDMKSQDPKAQINLLFDMLNAEGKDVAIDCVAGLAFIPKYQADPDVFPLKDDAYIRKED